MPLPAHSEFAGLAPDSARLPGPSKACAVVSFVLLVVVALGLLARSWHLSSWPALHGDEAINGVMAERLIDAGPAAAQRSREYFSLLFPHLLVPSIHILGRTILALRVLSLLAGMLSILAIYATGLRLFDRRGAQVAAACMAILPVGIIFGRLGWDVSLLPGLVATAFYLAVVAWQSRSIAAAMGAGLCMALGTWLHPTALLVPVSVAVAALAAGTLRQHLREAAITGIITVICSYIFFAHVISPQQPEQHNQGIAAYRQVAEMDTQGEWSSPWSLTLTAKNLLKSFDYLTGLTPARFLLHLEGPAVFAARIAGMLAWAIIVVAALRYGTPGRALIAYLATFLLLSHLANPAFINVPSKGRYLLGLLPLAPLLAAYVSSVNVGRCSRTWPSWTAAALAVLFACWVGVACLLLLHTGRGQTVHVEMMTAQHGDPKKLATDYLIEHGDPRHDIVIAKSWWTYWPLVYYCSGRLQLFTTDSMISETTVAEAWPEVRRVWYVGLSDTRGHAPPLQMTPMMRWTDAAGSGAELRIFMLTDTLAATEWLKTQLRHRGIRNALHKPPS
jgi:hypothetical protein